MERNLIAWTVPNWITITLMTVGSYLLFVILAQFVHRASGNTMETADA